MKKKGRIIALCIIGLFAIALIAGAFLWWGKSLQVDSYVITHYFGTDADAAAYVEALAGEGIFEKVFINEMPRIEIRATPTQVARWVGRNRRELDKELGGISPEEGFTAEVSEDATVITVGAGDPYCIPALTVFLTGVIYHAEMIQIFSGAQDWSVTLRIVDPGQKRLIYEVVYPEEDIDLREEQWTGVTPGERSDQKLS